MPRVEVEQMLARLRREEPDAWDELLGWLRARMLKLLARRGVERELSEDIVQDSLAVVWQRWRTVRDPARFWSWVVSIVLNRMRSAVGRVRAVEQITEEPLSAAHDPSAGLVRSEARRWIESHLSALHPDHSAAVRLRILESLDPAIAARRMGVSRVRLRRLLHQGKDSFRTSARRDGDRWYLAVGAAG
jgi:RNA polymerase sigma-70 factor (ECF subfamily)